MVMANAVTAYIVMALRQADALPKQLNVINIYVVVAMWLWSCSHGHVVMANVIMANALMASIAMASR